MDPDPALFANEPLSIDDLPRLADDAFEPVDASYLRVSLLASALVAVVAVVVGVVAAVVVDEGSSVPLVITAAVVAAAAISAALRVLEVRHMAYQVRAHDISYRSGVLIKTVSTVPFVRVQHARISQGPVERRFGLATLEVNSAGPDLAIKGLARTRADQLKGLVVERAGDLAEGS